MRVAKQPPSRGPITVPRETFDDLAQLEEVLRASKADLVVALTAWFKELPADIQGAFLDRRRDPSAEIARMKLASGPIDMHGVSLDEALHAARVALERMQIIRDAFHQQTGKKGK